MISTYIECRTADGCLVSLCCPEEAVDEIKNALAKTNSLDVPITHQVNVAHGGYGRYSRFNITQHKYAGGGHPGCGTYIEILEIQNPPDGRCGIVLHQDIRDYHHYGSTFWEFESIDDVLAIWDQVWYVSADSDSKISKSKGFKRKVSCGGLSPWFYAIGDQALFGDYAYPNHIGDDPIYRPLQKFVVCDEEDFPVIKTCMGCCQVTREMPNYGSGCGGSPKKKEYRVVYWDDGTVYDEQRHSKKPRPLTEKDIFAQEAVNQLKSCLAGRKREFVIHLSDGNRFTCKLQPMHKGKHLSSGTYFARAIMKGGESKAGCFEFTPTSEFPTVEHFLQHKGVKEIQALKFQQGTGGKKKWVGVFPAPHLETV